MGVLYAGGVKNSEKTENDSRDFRWGLHTLFIQLLPMF